MKHVMIAALISAGCSSGDKCQRVADKVAPIMEKELGAKRSAGDQSKMVEKCKAELKRDPGQEKMLDCILAISGTATVADIEKCAEASNNGFKSYKDKSQRTEAQLMLNKISKSAKVAYATNNEFPKGKVGPSPAAPCCQGAGTKCAVDPNAWKDPVWQGLDFQIDDPHLFQYTYESSDGQSFTATAIGDLDCDTQMITYTVKGTVDNGNPKTEVTDPTTED